MLMIVTFEQFCLGDSYFPKHAVLYVKWPHYSPQESSQDFNGGICHRLKKSDGGLDLNLVPIIPPSKHLCLLLLKLTYLFATPQADIFVCYFCVIEER